MNQDIDVVFNSDLHFSFIKHSNSRQDLYFDHCNATTWLQFCYFDNSENIASRTKDEGCNYTSQKNASKKLFYFTRQVKY